jgi:D-3-phosphoglycerate dehydrogenase
MGRPVLIYFECLQYLEETLGRLGENFRVISFPDPSHETGDALNKAEVLMAPLGFECGPERIDKCPNLKVIASSTLSVPHIDVEYARSKGIRVCWFEGETELLATITPTAELAFGLIIAITRHLPWAHNAACERRWGGRPFGQRTPRMLSRMTLGILGLGRLGSLVASYGKAFGMEVLYYSPNSANRDHTRCDSPEELAARSDIVSLHAHHTPETERIVDRGFLAAMPEGSFLVNTARGELVDEEALLEALRSGHLAGAALDVLAGEFDPGFRDRLAEGPLVAYAREHENLIITPHYGGSTMDSWETLENKIVELVLESL